MEGIIMAKKTYKTPLIYSESTLPEEVLALSIIRDGEANQDCDVLVKGNDWDIFDDDSSLIDDNSFE